MKLEEARELAIKRSKENSGAVQHVNVLIRETKERTYEVDQEHYYVSDWIDGTNVESYIEEDCIYKKCPIGLGI